MSTGMKPKDVLVVGGGLSGLAAATYLGRTGLQVELLERSNDLGGRAKTTVKDGFSLNRGPHALYVRGEGAKVLRDLGVEAPGGMAPLGGHAYARGSFFKLPVNASSLLSTRLFGWREKFSAAEWFAKIPGLDPITLRHVSVMDFLDRTKLPREARAVFEAFVRISTYANAPDRMSAATAVLQLQKAQGGVRYVDGGWRTLVDGLAKRAASFGVKLTRGARAVALSGGAAAPFRVTDSNGTEFFARAVVIAVPPRAAAELLASAGAAVPESITNAVPLCIATLDVALSRLPRPEARFALGIDRPLYLSVHSGVAKLAPPGGAMIHVAKYLPAGDTDPEADRAELETLLDLAQPGYRDAIVHVAYLPRLVAAERLDLASEGGAAGRPPMAVPDLPGVFLSGDWVSGGSWIADASLESGRLAAAAITSRSGSARAVA